jgi:hypothetical protein
MLAPKSTSESMSESAPESMPKSSFDFPYCPLIPLVIPRTSEAFRLKIAPESMPEFEL